MWRSSGGPVIGEALHSLALGGVLITLGYSEASEALRPLIENRPFGKVVLAV